MGVLSCTWAVAEPAMRRVAARKKALGNFIGRLMPASYRKPPKGEGLFRAIYHDLLHKS